MINEFECSFDMFGVFCLPFGNFVLISHIDCIMPYIFMKVIYIVYTHSILFFFQLKHSQKTMQSDLQIFADSQTSSVSEKKQRDLFQQTCNTRWCSQYYNYLLDGRQVDTVCCSFYFICHVIFKFLICVLAIYQMKFKHLVRVVKKKKIICHVCFSCFLL